MTNTLVIIVTGAGAPGIQGTIYSLRSNYDSRNVYIIGTDINEFVVGKYLCDEFYVISPAKNKEQYVADLQQICIERGVNIIIPQNTAELYLLASQKQLFANLGVQIVVSDAESIETANNKYKLFGIAKDCNLPVANYSLVSKFNDLKTEAEKLGWPKKKIVVKPPVSNGSRGVRVIVEDMDRKKAFYEEKPSSLFISLEELHAVLGDEFPELIIMDYLPGDEYTVDVFRFNQHFLAIPRKRIVVRSGITFAASLEKNDFLIDYSRQLAEATDLKFCFGFQFKISEKGQPLLLESNPRVQGTMVMSTFANANIIYNSVKVLTGDNIPEIPINWNTKLLRYWGAVNIQENESVRI